MLGSVPLSSLPQGFTDDLGGLSLFLSLSPSTSSLLRPLCSLPLSTLYCRIPLISLAQAPAARSSFFRGPNCESLTARGEQPSLLWAPSGLGRDTHTPTSCLVPLTALCAPWSPTVHTQERSRSRRRREGVSSVAPSSRCPKWDHFLHDVNDVTLVP